MSLTTPCIIIFDEQPNIYDYFFYAPDATFKTLQLGSSSYDQVDTHTYLDIRDDGIYYDSLDNQIYDGGYWTNDVVRGIYVESWGSTVTQEELDDFEAWLNDGNGNVRPVNLSDSLIQFHQYDIIAYKTYAYLSFTSNAHAFDYMAWEYSNSRLRYDLGDTYTIYPYTVDYASWIDDDYRTVQFGSSGTDIAKPVFALWIWLSAEPKSLPTYKLGWRYTPQS